MATSQAGLDAAYKTEINNCSFNADAGTRIMSRPRKFCDTATFDVPIEVTGSVNVDGVPYKPASIDILGAKGTILTANGLPLIYTPPTPPGSTFDDIVVTGTATIANGVMDAGSY